MLSIVVSRTIREKIHTIRGQRVMLAPDLATLYGVSTKRLNEQVRRNLRRFPLDFMFRLTSLELGNLRSQFATSSTPVERASWGGARYLPLAFTEQGVAMLSSVLNSERAIDVNIAIMRAFVRIRTLTFRDGEISSALKKLGKKVKVHDIHIRAIFETIRGLIHSPSSKKRDIGFQTK